MIDDGLIEFLTGGQFDPDFSYNMKRKSLDKDNRINKKSFSSVDAAYRDLVAYEQTPAARNTERVKSLLTTDAISASDLRNTLQSVYGYSNEDVNNVFRNLENSQDIEVHQNMFTKNITFRKKL